MGDTARILSERFGKNVQCRESLSISPEQQSTSYSTQLDSLIPAAKISNLSQGMGSPEPVADNFGEEIEQKVFHAKIVVDTAAVAREEKSYVPIPQISFFEDENGEDCMERQIEENYDRIRVEVNQIIKDEMERIKTDPALRHLIPEPKKGLPPGNPRITSARTCPTVPVRARKATSVSRIKSMSYIRTAKTYQPLKFYYYGKTRKNEFDASERPMPVHPDPDKETILLRYPEDGSVKAVSNLIQDNKGNQEIVTTDPTTKNQPAFYQKQRQPVHRQFP